VNIFVIPHDVTLGLEVDRLLGPLLLVSFLSTAAFSALWSFIGICAATFMHAGSITIGIMYSLDALAAAATGYLGGVFPIALVAARLLVSRGGRNH